MSTKSRYGVAIAIVFVIILIIIAITTVMIVYVIRRRKKQNSPSDGSDTPNGSNTPDGSDTPPSSCIGLTTTPNCYKCMVSPLNKPPNCPDCNKYPNDPTCTIDCTKNPRDPNCPDCTKYSDAPGCDVTNPPLSSNDIIEKMQNGKGTLSSASLGGCLNISTSITSQGWPNIKDGTSINQAVCVPNDHRQIWGMDSNKRLIIIDSDKKRCLSIATDKGIPRQGASLHMWKCNESGNQSWIPKVSSYNPSQFMLINAGNSSLCLDSSPGIGYSPALSICDETVPGQFWTFNKS
jgi:hypothetical protein